MEICEDAFHLRFHDEKDFDANEHQIIEKLMNKVMREEDRRLRRWDFICNSMKLASVPSVDFVLSKAKGEAYRSNSQKSTVSARESGQANLFELIQKYLNLEELGDPLSIFKDSGLDLDPAPFLKVTTHRDRTNVLGDLNGILKEKRESVLMMSLPHELRNGPYALWYKHECARNLTRIVQGISNIKGISEWQA